MPLTSKPARPGPERTRRSLVVGAVLSVLLAASATSAQPAQAATPTTYQGAQYPTAGGSPSADKPQSKLWYADGAWWGLLRTSSGITIHRLEDHVWRDTQTVVDERLASTGDALWDGDRLYVATRTGSGAMRVVRFSYDASADQYSRDFSQQIASNGTESITVAKDSRQRLWVSYTRGGRVYVAHSTTDDATWTAPFLVPVADNTVSSDDISAVIAFDGKVGVMYSDQGNDTMHFAVHADSAADDTWTLEAALSGSNLADDHINLKSLLQDDEGRIYAAIKTSRGDAGEPSTDPSVVVLQRTATGTWSAATAASVGDKLTRAQLALDSTGRRLFVLMGIEGGGPTVYYKSAPLGALAFGTGRGSPFISWAGAMLNDPSTTKQGVDATTGLVVLAADDKSTPKRYYHGELSLATSSADTAAPTVPQAVTGTAVSSTSVELTWQPSTDDVGVTGYRVFRAGVAVGTTGGTSFTDTGLTAGTSYTYTVAAFDAAGNVSAQSSPVSVTTSASTAEAEPTSEPAFVGAASASGATTSTSVGSPAGVAAGDVLVAALSVRGAPTIPTPSGWTLVRLDSNGTTMRQAVFSRVADDSSEGSTWTLSSAKDHVVQVAAYRGVETTDPVIASAGSTSTSTTIPSPAVSSTSGARVVSLVGFARTATLTSGAPLLERIEVTSPSTASYKVTASISDMTATGTSAGPFTTTASGTTNNGGVGQSIALRPRG